jgi:hypothetical protein
VACDQVTVPANILVPWDIIVPDWDCLPVHFKYSVVPRFFAVIAFHYNWLRENLHTSHPIFHCALFTTHLSLLLAATNVVKREKIDMRHATGVSLSVRTAIHVQQLQNSSTTRSQEQAEPTSALTSSVSAIAKALSKQLKAISYYEA